MSISAGNSRPMARRSRPLMAIALLGLTASCAVGPDFTPPQTTVADRYNTAGDPKVTTAASGIVQSFDTTTALPADWWVLFGTPPLSAMVEEASRNNPDLAASQAALRASQESLRAGYGVFYPQIAGGADATRERAAPIRSGQALSGGVFNLFSLSASVSYALDVFGGDRRMIEALGASVDLSKAETRATALTLSANIVNTAIARAAYRAEIDATERMIANLTAQVKLARVRATSGTEAYAASLALESELATTEAELPALAQKYDQAGTLLATLVGRMPGSWSPPDLDLDAITLPKTIPVSLPSRLVSQRPDIVAAEASLHAASADIGVATAAMLPSITLSAGYSANGTKTSTLFNASGAAWDLGAGLTAPIFEGGSLWHRRKQSVEIYHQAAATYRQTVLAGFEQVADALKALDHDAAILAAREQSQAAADQALALLQDNYAAGLVSYDQVLLSDLQDRQARIQRIDATAARLQDTTALFVAIGGGWWSADVAAH